MENGMFDIATEEGALFCRCDDSGETPVFYGKSGKLNLELLLKQAHNRDLAREMRGKKIRRQHDKQQAI